MGTISDDEIHVITIGEGVWIVIRVILTCGKETST